MSRTQIQKLLPLRAKIGLSRFLSSTLQRIGYNISRSDDYSSPLPDVSSLRKNIKRWDRPSALKGIAYDLEGMERLLGELLDRYLDEFLELPSYDELKKIGFGPGYTHTDALTLYLMIRHLKPERYIEVGSGLSTYYCSLAAEQNRKEGFPLQITCIEPYPYPKLDSIAGIDLIVDEVQNVDITVFTKLEANDVFFIDSSHMLRLDSDVPFLYLNVLPSLSKGVNIHIHDVPFPYNVPYPAEFWVFGEYPVYWNEAMIVQAFLAFNKDFEIVLSTPLLRFFDEKFLKERVPTYQTIDQEPNAFSSLWLRRIG